MPSGPMRNPKPQPLIQSNSFAIPWHQVRENYAATVKLWLTMPCGLRIAQYHTSFSESGVGNWTYVKKALQTIN